MITKKNRKQDIVMGANRNKRKRHRGNRRRSGKGRKALLIVEIGLGIVALFLVMVLVMAKLFDKLGLDMELAGESGTIETDEPDSESKEETDSELPTFELESGTKETGETGETPEAETEEPETIYFPPEYQFDTSKDLVRVEIPGLKKSYRIAWVSDVHIISDLKAADDVMEEYVETLRTRYEKTFVTASGIHSKDLWPQIIDYLNCNDFDGVIFGGDIMDYCSQSNLDVFMKGYERLKYEPEEILYIRADHDYGYTYGGEVMTETRAHELHATLIDGKSEYNYLDEFYRALDFDEFMIVGIDGSTKNPIGDQVAAIREYLQMGKPVILATHVPYEPLIEKDKENLAALSMKVRNKIYYWSEDSENYIPDDRQKDFLNDIYKTEDMQIKQVLAGHLHHQWDGMLTEVLPQHIFTPAYLGAIGIIEVVPAK